MTRLDVPFPEPGPWTGTLYERFRNPATDWFVGSLQLVTGEIATVVGVMVGAVDGATVTVDGRWVDDTKWGTQLKVTSFTEVAPTGAAEMENYLKGKRVKGIGPALATAIVGHFGENTRTIMDNEPERLLEVSGIGASKLAGIITSWAEQAETRDLVMALAAIDPTPNLIGRIRKTFGDRALTVATKYPYDLVKVPGISFPTADALAQKMGMARDDPMRLRAGLTFVIDRGAESDGHCYLPQATLVTEAVKRLGVPAALIKPVFDECLADGSLVLDDLHKPGLTAGEMAVYTRRSFDTEYDLADTIAGILCITETPVTDNFSTLEEADWVKELAIDGKPEPAPAQAQAVKTALTRTFSVLTGGPGCGKSHTIGTLVAVATAAGFSVQLAAPTGRAAQRMTELAGVKATTIHRMLAMTPEDTDDEPDFDDEPGGVSTDVLIIDELSMLDVSLGLRLMRAIEPGTHVVLVGDEDQLPSIGPGRVLSDLLACPMIPNTRLTHVFRQAAKSGIKVAAHAVNNGDQPNLEPGAYTDFVWRDAEMDVQQQLVDLIARELPATHGVKPHHIQLLTPKRGGNCGVDALNARLQEVLNPARPGRNEIVHGSRTFREGDRVMQIRNNYKLDIYNGTPALIEWITPAQAFAKDSDDAPEWEMTIITDEGQPVTYTKDQLGELVLAYAITIHKAQGSEYPIVVMPILTEAWYMLRRNLLYTGITRARNAVTIVGHRKALNQAVRTVDTHKRHTALTARIIHHMNAIPT